MSRFIYIFYFTFGKHKHNTSLQGNKAASQMQDVK